VLKGFHEQEMFDIVEYGPMMKRLVKNISVAAALLIALAWPAHEVFAHNSADNDCQVCAVSCSPELNADCGTVLLAAPVNFVILCPVSSVQPDAAELPLAFLGRAPPLA